MEQELKFLTKLAKRYGNEQVQEEIICLHRHEITRLSLDKEYAFFNQKLSDELRNKIIGDIDAKIEQLSSSCSSCSCHLTVKDLKTAGVYEEYLHASCRDDTKAMKILIEKAGVIRSKK